MYPYDLFAGLDLYTLLMAVGIIACLCLIRLQGDWRGLSAKLQNLVLVNTVATVICGYGFSVLFQAYYNYRAGDKFEIVRNTGATFYGGLIGGAAVFILVYFLAGHFLFPDGYHKHCFRTVADLSAACITAAHGFGRLGCLMAGCCHGRPTDAWYGITMHIPGHAEPVKVIPVQLYEAVFLFALCALLLWGFKRGRKYLLASYMMVYAVWRFSAELLRGDDRGATVVAFLSPSQYISVLLLLGGLLLLVLQLYADTKTPAPAEDEETDVGEPEDEADADCAPSQAEGDI